MNNFIAKLIPGVLVSLVLLSSCAKDKTAPATTPVVAPARLGSLTVDVLNMVGTDTLLLDAGTYRSPAGEQFTVNNFNYYLSNFKLRRADGSEYAVNNRYFLIRERPPRGADNGKHFVLDSIPEGNYTGVSFLIGVDEAHNTAGAQAGALDPANAMFWNWKQGYIFLQLEGSSPQSAEPSEHMIAYHVGDFQNPNNLRVVAPALPGGTANKVLAGQLPALKLQADILRLFAGPAGGPTNPVQFGSFWAAVGGAEAGQIATNYSGSTDREVPGTNSMFSVTAVQNK